ncbi:sugar MFS transporter [Frankia sp. CiP3]|uniref:MFS transporter n=1 Tax=Frankia sp. CiP3 TaxID=2880971 RepID=UPI001EF41ED5|nr:MFS transporter [Frankia sp. CiP3]
MASTSATETQRAPAGELRGGTVFLAFAAFGLLWGLYAAAIPEIKRDTGASDGALGAALVCVALAAAPAVFTTGRLLDRCGRPVAVAAVCAFAVVAALPTLVGSVPWLVITLLLFGFGSGACDVVINSLAATVEAETGTKVLNRAHALFSVGMLVGAVVTSVIRASGGSASWPMIGLGAATVLGAVALRGRVPARIARAAKDDDRPSGRWRINPVVLALGGLAALAMLVESGVQQWSAVYLENEVAAPPGVSGLAPGVFAGAMALGRLGGHWLSTRASDRVVLAASGLLSGGGVIVVAVAHHPLVALLGLGVAGAAISVGAPTVYSVAGQLAAPERRGAVIGATASIGYIGLLLGPAVVGQLASVTELRTAIGALAVVSLAVSLAGLRVPTREDDQA